MKNYYLADFILSAAGFAATALLLAGSAAAQIGTAVLVGRVTDPAGAVIPRAAVEARRTSTNEFFRTTTTDSGDYTIVNLAIDTYDIRVASPSFRTEVHTGIKLEVGQTARIDFQLSVGAVSESVEVKGTAPMLKTEAPTFGQVIDNTKIVGLPLNQRDVLGTLASLTPGVAPARSGRLGSGLNFNVRGQRAIDNVAILDGATISQGNAFVTFNTNPDAVAEFEVKTGLYGAEYGIRPGGQFSMVTKSGTNSLHGTVFEYLRNNALDARNFFDRASRPPYKRNQFGATAGAPIYLPKIFNGRDKAWFFFAYSGQRQHQFSSLTGVVPTMEQKAGRFTTTLVDPLSGQPFPNNTIPSSRFNPVTQKLLRFWPDPNTAGQAFNFTSPNSNTSTKIDQVIARIDVRVSDNDHWSGRFIFDNSPNLQANAIQTFQRLDPLRTWTQSITNTRTIKQKVVNEFTANFYRRPYYPGLQTSGAGLGRTLGINNFPASPADEDGVPVTSVTGFLSLSDASRVGPSITGHWEARDTLTFNRGAHSIKAGYHWRRHIEFHGYIGRSTFAFQPRYSGNSFADFLLGYLTSSTQGADQLRDREYQNGQYLFLQDDWKVSSRLTLNLGLRYEYRGPWQDQRGYGSNFDLSTLSFNPPLQNLTLQPWQTGRYLPNRPMISFNKKGILPRLGLAYRLTSKTVIRSGYGAFANEPPLGMVSSVTTNPRPNAAVRNFISDPRVPNLFASDPFNAVGQSASTAVPDLYSYANPLPQNLSHGWGFAVQHQLTPNTALEVGYQGSHSVHDYIITEANDAVPGAAARQSRRPYPQFQTIRQISGSGDTSYNGLEIKVERRPGPSGLSTLLSYTWSKSLDTIGARLNGGGDPTEVSRNLTLKNNRGAGEANPNRLVLNVGYELPFGHAKSHFTQGPMAAILGGWSTFTILTLEKGTYITAVVPTDRMDVGSTASSRPDLLRSPNLPVDQRTPPRWFDTGAFVLPLLSEYRYGNAGRSIIEGPGLMNLDFSLLRNFTLTERARLQFRFEAFNITNHPNFMLPGNSFGTATFGAITSAQEARDLQFGLKIYF